MDKLEAKRRAGDALGAEWIIPTLWTGLALPAEPPFPFPAILKARHGCNQYAPLPLAPSARDWRTLRRRANTWTRHAYGKWLDEWAYCQVPRGLFAEPFVGDAPALPVDYKIYVFGGVATHVQIHLDRGHSHRWVLHDRDWRQLVRSGDSPVRPASLPAMLDAAERLSAGFDFLRVDFFEVAGRPLFAEFCLYPGSGLDPFAAPWIDVELGGLWITASDTGSITARPYPHVACEASV